jgi:hypothetical protein
MTTLGVGSGAAIAGLLGMNLKNFMEDWQYGFPVVTSLAFGTSMLVCGYGLSRLKRIQKLTLYGRYPGIAAKNSGNGITSYNNGNIAKVKKWKMGWMRHYDDEHIRRMHWWKRIMRGGRYGAK